MPKPTLPIALFTTVLLTAVAACWGDYQQQKNTLQLQLSRLAEHLSTHLVAEPAYAAELMTFARASSPLQLRSLELQDAAGKQQIYIGEPADHSNHSATVTAPLPDETFWRQPLADGRQLVLSAAAPSFPLFWLLLCLPLLPMAGLVWWFMRRWQQQYYGQVLQEIPPEFRLQASAESAQHELVQTVRRLVQQHQEAQHQAALNLQIMQSQQKLHVDQQAETRQQLNQAERHNIQYHRALQSWHHLAEQAPQLHQAELRHWLGLLRVDLQQTLQLEPVSQGIAQWFAQSISSLKLMWPETILLLPDEDPDASRCQAMLNGQFMQQLLHSVLLAVKPLIDGKEVLISYRLDSGSRDKLLLKIQYTGKSLSARHRQVLMQGGLAEPEWADMPFEVSHQLLKLLSAELQILELADLGSRLDLNIPISGQNATQNRRFQNLVICDPRPCRLELWRHSLLGVSEQVVATGSLMELKQALQSRLVDCVVVHWYHETMTEHEIADLQQISNRYQLILFAPESLQLRLGAQLAGHKFVPPLLLAGLQDLPTPGSQFSSQQLLIVDDNPTNLSFIRAMLSDQGISIDFATTGQEALKLASHSRYQLILMDIQLPDLSGIEVTKRIRQLRHHQQTVILAFTGHALPEEAVSFRLAGMDDVMTKPLDARKIAHILSRIRPLAETQ